MLMNIFYQTLTDSEHIPPPILHVKAFQIFLFFYLYSPFPRLSLSRKNKAKKPGTAAVPKIAKSKTGHNCRACFFPPFPFPFNFQRSPSAIFLFTSTASLNIENPKEPQKEVSLNNEGILDHRGHAWPETQLAGPR